MQSNKLNLTLKLTSFQAIISLSDKLKLHNSNIRLKNDLTTYLPYILSQGIIDCIRTVKPDLRQRKLVKYTKNLALGIGTVSSAIVSLTYDGSNYIVTFSFLLFKNTVTTLIIDKLNNLKVDGVSVAILLNLILSIPSIIVGMSTQPLLSGLLFIASIGAITCENFKLLKSTEDVDIHYKDTKDKFSLSTRNTYTTSLIISSFITSIAPNPIVQSGLMLIVNPLIQWFLSSSTVNTEEINKYLKHSNTFISNLKHDKDTEDYLKHMIRLNSIKLGLVGTITFIVCSLLIKVFAIAISPVILSIAVNSFINVSFSVKSLVKSSNLKGMGSFAG